MRLTECYIDMSLLLNIFIQECSSRFKISRPDIRTQMHSYLKCRTGAEGHAKNERSLS